LAISSERRAARRRRLVEVAQALIRERGDAGFSMAQLAAAAGVSPATPYNLLGSKAELLRLVVREDFARFTGRLPAVGREGPLASLLHACDLVVVHYEADRQFHRGLFRAAFSADAAEVRDLMSMEGFALWHGLVEAAMVGGDLEGPVRSEPLARVLVRAISAAAQCWLAEGWSRERFELELGLSIRLVLASVAAPAFRDALVAQLAAMQRALTQLTFEAPPHAQTRPVRRSRLSDADGLGV
jgi:AcrR family transcriptional regulator